MSLNHQKKNFINILFFLIIILLPLDFVLLYGLFFINRIYPNIYVNNLLIGGKTIKKAEIALTDYLNNNSQQITLTYANKEFLINKESFDLKYDVQNSVANAYAYTREGNPLTNFIKRIEVLQGPVKTSLIYSFNEKKLDDFIASISASVNEEMIPPSILLEEKAGQKTASVSAGKVGRQLNVDKTKKTILAAFLKQNFEKQNLLLEESNNKIAPEQIQNVKQLADNLLGKTLILKQDENEWTLKEEELINFLSVYSNLDEVKIASWAGELAKIVDKEPQNALFKFEGEKVTEFKPGKPGVKLKLAQSIQALKDGIIYLTSSNIQTHQINLEIDKTDPAVSTSNVNNLGIKELLGKGESWFYHSIPGRIHNIELASAKMNGILVPPGEEFSVLKYVSPINSSQGYQTAYIIQNGRTVLGDGGGVCQTSTTMFRAALDAGLEIIERHPHAYRVEYYEQKSDVGIDASVFEPNADFRFKNDTPAHLLIQTYVDPVNTYVRYEIYGTSDGRKATIGKATVWNQSAPGPDIYQDDPTLPAGTVKQIDWKAWGAKVSFDWKVERDGQILRQNTFWSNYQPWQAVFLRGTAGQ
ncbi:hypothetical protein GYA19_05070 [Candidatus Beckwithbacteria bacterium]|nr:hypothetical protein [Candidatus Beckwithbacteria bacterium]